MLRRNVWSPRPGIPFLQEPVDQLSIDRVAVECLFGKLPSAFTTPRYIDLPTANPVYHAHQPSIVACRYRDSPTAKVHEPRSLTIRRTRGDNHSPSGQGGKQFGWHHDIHDFSKLAHQDYVGARKHVRKYPALLEGMMGDVC